MRALDEPRGCSLSAGDGEGVGGATMKWLARQEQNCIVVAMIRGGGNGEKDRGELSHSTIRALRRMGRSVGELQSEWRGQSIVRGRRRLCATLAVITFGQLVSTILRQCVLPRAVYMVAAVTDVMLARFGS
jgi:hypothetical protein